MPPILDRLSIIKKRLADKVFVHSLKLYQLVYRYSSVHLVQTQDQKVHPLTRQPRPKLVQIKFLKSEIHKSLLLLAISKSAISADSSAESIYCTYKHLQTVNRELSQDIKKPCQRHGFERADEEIRTLDILLGKEMLYH